jgi:single-strand DNA-binding protein
MATNLRLHSLNDVKMVGRLTRDPELRFTTQGIPVCHFRIAASRPYKDRNSSEWKEDVAFVPCVVWRESAERCNTRLKKGSPVFVEGRLRSREWQTKEGQKRSELELDVQRIQFLEAMDSGEREAVPAAGGSEYSQASRGNSSPSSEPAGSFDADPSVEEEVPF